jgi:hypothetical protein
MRLREQRARTESKKIKTSKSMKTAITLVAILALVGCGKDPDPTFCWECTKTVNTECQAGCGPDMNPQKNEYCKLTEAQINEQIKPGTNTTTTTEQITGTNQTQTVHWTTTTTCTKKQ